MDVLSIDWDHDHVVVFEASGLDLEFVDRVLALKPPSEQKVNKNGRMWRPGNEWPRDLTPQGLDDDRLFREYADLDKLLDDLDEPTRLILEATFRSFWTKDRDDFVRRCRAEGHDLRTPNTRFIPRVRGWSGFNLGDAESSDDDRANYKGSDREDAYCLYFTARLFFDPIPTPNLRGEHEDRHARYDFARQMANALRKSGDKAALSAILHRRFRERDEYDARSIRDLIKPGQVSLAVAAAAANDRDEFEEIAGMHAGGYGGVIRSDVIHHGWGNYNAAPKHEQFTLSEFRNACRWFGSQVNKLVQDPPEDLDPVARHWLIDVFDE